MNDVPTLILLGMVIVALAGAWMWTITNVITTPDLSHNQKVVWFLVLLILQTFGLLLYLAISPNQKDRDKRRALSRM